jgi:hypothetical protein
MKNKNKMLDEEIGRKSLERKIGMRRNRIRNTE